MPEGITVFNGQCNVFWPIIATIISAFLKKTTAIELTVLLGCMKQI